MAEFHDDDLTYVGRCYWQEGQSLVGIKRRDRRLHTYVLRKSGVGKNDAPR